MSTKKLKTRSRLLDEAYNIKELQDSEMSLQDIANETHHTVAWVQIRCMVNGLSDGIKQQFFDLKKVPDLVIQELFHVRQNQRRQLEIINEYKASLKG